MIVDGDTCIGKWVEEQRTLDIQHGQIAPWLNNLPAGGFAVDVGAFIGDTAIVLAQKVGRYGRVLAIEANPVSFKCLEHNARLPQMNGCVATVQCLIGSGKEKGNMIQSPNSGASFAVKKDDAQHESVSLDDLLSAYAPKTAPHFIKMDIEGWEPLAIEGSVKTLETYKPDLLIEVNHGALECQNYSAEDIFNPLQKLGYGYKITDKNLTMRSPQFDAYFYHLSK